MSEHDDNPFPEPTVVLDEEPRHREPRYPRIWGYAAIALVVAVLAVAGGYHLLNADPTGRVFAVPLPHGADGQGKTLPGQDAVPTIPLPNGTKTGTGIATTQPTGTPTTDPTAGKQKKAGGQTGTTAPTTGPTDPANPTSTVSPSGTPTGPCTSTAWGTLGDVFRSLCPPTSNP